MKLPIINKAFAANFPPLVWVLMAGVSGFFPLKLLFGVEFLAAELFGLTALVLFGPAWGMAAVLAGSFPTLLYWGHPYAMLFYTAEMAFVSWLVRKKDCSLIHAVFAYWLIPGPVLTWLVYKYVLHVPDESIWFVLFKMGANGLAASSAAALAVPLLYRLKLRAPRLFPECAFCGFDGHRSLTLTQLISSLMTALLLAGMLTQLTLTSKQQIHSAEAQAALKLEDAINGLNHALPGLSGEPDYPVFEAFASRFADTSFFIIDLDQTETVRGTGGRMLPTPVYLATPAPTGSVRIVEGAVKTWAPDMGTSSKITQRMQSVYFATDSWTANSRYRLAVSMSAGPYWKQIYRDLTRGLAVLYIFTGLATILMVPVNRRLTKKLVLLSEQSVRFSSRMGTDYRPEWPDSGFRELHSLSASLRIMADELNRLFGDMQLRQQQLESHAARTSEELDLERSRIEGILSNIRDVVWSVDAPTGKLRYISPACKELFGYPDTYFYSGVDWISRLVHEEDRLFVISYRKAPSREATGHATIRFRIRLPDGTVKWLQDRSWCVLDDQGQVIRIDGIVSDITETLKAQESLLQLSYELSQEKERIEVQRNITQSILEATREGMVLCGSDGRILYANSRLKDFFGVCCMHARTLDELVEKLPGLHPEYASLLLKDLHVFLRQQAADVSLRRSFSYSVGSQEFHYFLYAAPIQEQTGLEGSHLLVFRDRTEEVQEEVLKEELANQISHELRTPLTSIMGFSEIMYNRELPPARQKQYVETIFHEAVRLSRLVDDFLDLQRMEAGHQRYFLVPLDMRQLAEETAQQWRMETSRTLSVHVPEQAAVVLADEDRMKQVLHNLLSNAFKYSPEGNPVTLDVRQDNGIVYVDITDEGLGIPEEEKAKIFRKFYRIEHPDRRKIPGSGLGLPIVKEIVEAHRGEITFRSEHGAGSVFSIWMPAYTAPETEGKAILIQRDEDYTEELAGALRQKGGEVLPIRSFEEVLFALRSGRGMPRLIAADLVGAGLMNGLEFASEFRKLAPSGTTLIFLEALDRSHAGGFRDSARFVNRSFSALELAELAETSAGKEPLGADADGNALFRCCFPLQDQTQLKAQLAKFGLVPASLQEDGAGIWAFFPVA